MDKKVVDKVDELVSQLRNFCLEHGFNYIIDIDFMDEYRSSHVNIDGNAYPEMVIYANTLKALITQSKAENN